MATGVKQLLAPSNGRYVVVHTDGRCVDYHQSSDGAVWTPTLVHNNVAHASVRVPYLAIVDGHGSAFARISTAAWQPIGTRGTPTRKIFLTTN
ncbi:hypothetical protein Sros01_03400 [Streptomyces roseochromogenus]|nr:hypothetical protein Sros01_03400 [Streptomyces roseochromogenus]